MSGTGIIEKREDNEGTIGHEELDIHSIKHPLQDVKQIEFSTPDADIQSHEDSRSSIRRSLIHRSSISTSEDQDIRSRRESRRTRLSGISQHTSRSSSSRLTFPSTARDRSSSTLSLKSEEAEFFCDWYPELFGIDEDVMALSEEELIEEDENELPTKTFTPSESDMLRVDSKEDLTNEELIKLWKMENRLKYGRRARTKPVLERKDGTRYECLCEIDNNFQRHYVPRFGGGVKEKGEEWRTPHFDLFWQDFHDVEAGKKDDDTWLKELDIGKTQAEVTEEKVQFVGPTAKFDLGRKATRKFRDGMLAKLQPLDCREIRRFRLPYSEAIYLELQEDGYLETAAFFKHLLTKERQVHSGEIPVPLLRKSKPKINKLVNILKECERKGRKNERNKQSIILLTMGKYFNDDQPSWWWLSEELYSKAVEVTNDYIIDGGRSEAVSRYVLGTFLLDCMNKTNEAKEHLTKARELSSGKDWNASKILNAKQDSIYRECSNYLSRALVATGRELRKNGRGEEGLPLVHQAYKLCQESYSTRKDVKMDVIFELGMIYQSVGMSDWAKTAFRKFITMAKVEGKARKICDGYLELATCFRDEGNLKDCQECLKIYLETAIASEDENLKAFGNRCLGEFHLNNGNSKVAAEFLETSFFSFYQQYENRVNIPFSEWGKEIFTLPQDAELARALVGLAKGELLTRAICKLILQARDIRNQSDALKLLKWKNANEQVFDTEIPESTDKTSASSFDALGDGLTEDKSSGEKFTSSVATEEEEGEEEEKEDEEEKKRED